jgi:hypothetical protein
MCFLSEIEAILGGNLDGCEKEGLDDVFGLDSAGWDFWGFSMGFARPVDLDCRTDGNSAD